MPEKCNEIKPNGERCKAYTIKGSKKCWRHAPELKAKRDRACKNGGRKRKTPRGNIPGEVRTVEDILTGVNRSLADAWELDNTAERGRLLATLYGLALNVVRPTETEERLDRIEEALGIGSAEEVEK